MTLYFPRCKIILGLFSEFSKEITSWEVIPENVNIVRNSTKMADSWSLEVSYKDFPVEPESIVTGSAALFLWDGRDNMSNNPTISGILDSAEVVDDKSGSVVRLAGQDFTALFLETQFKKKRVSNNIALEKALLGLIKEVDRGPQKTLNLVVDLSDEQKDKIPSIGKGSTKTNRRRGFTARRGESYWDVMTRLAQKNGYVLYMRGTNVVLTTPRFAREEALSRKLYSLTWGKNILSVRRERNMGKEKAPQIELRARDDRTKKTLRARFPKKGKIVTTGVGAKRNERQVEYVYGVRDQETLNRLAEQRYEQLARPEQVVTVTTRELVDDADQSLIDIQSADGMFVNFDPYNTEVISQMEPGQAIDFLTNKGYSFEAASLVVDNYTKLKIYKRPFYVREAVVEWSATSGFSLEVTLVNFVIPEHLQEEGDIDEET